MRQDRKIWPSVLRPDGISRGFEPGLGGWFHLEAPRYTGPGAPPYREEGPEFGFRGHRHEPPRLRWAEERKARAMIAADRIRVRRIMTADPAAVTPGTSIAEAARIMEDLDTGVVPVVDSHDRKRLVGVITDRDLAVRGVAHRKGADTPVSECMSPGAHTVNQNDSIRTLMGVMRAHRVRRVPVVDREGRLVGIVAQADLAVDYAGLDLERELEVEETIERISEPARPRRTGRTPPLPAPAEHLHGGYVFGPTDQGGDVGFRPEGARGLDEW